MTVLDASVVVSALVDDNPIGEWCRAQLEHEFLMAPHLLPVETQNAIRSLESRGRIDSTAATIAAQTFDSMTISLFPFLPFGARIWHLRSSIIPYNAWYVALAEAFDCALVTLDVRLARSNRAECPIVTPPEDIAIRA